LINLGGEVVGINTAIISRSGGSQGIGFAIPSNTVRTALESLLKQGRIIRGYLGILARANQPGQKNEDNEGVVVDDVVPGSPAAAAQLQKGDIIRKFDGHDVQSFLQLRTLVSQVELNKNVELEVIRDGKSIKVATQIKEQPIDYMTSRTVPRQSPSQPPPDENEPNETTGALASVHVADLTPETARQLDLPNGVRGVVVTNVDPDSGVAELQKGDVIEEVNQQPVASVSEYNKVVASLDPNQAQVLSVCRHRVRSFLVLRAR
jgi:serine protease Do